MGDLYDREELQDLIRELKLRKKELLEGLNGNEEESILTLRKKVVELGDKAVELKKEYNVSMTKPKGKYNCIIVTVAHKEFLKINEVDLLSYIEDDTYIIDVKGIWHKKTSLKFKNYWCL